MIPLIYIDKFISFWKAREREKNSEREKQKKEKDKGKDRERKCGHLKESSVQ